MTKTEKISMRVLEKEYSTRSIGELLTAFLHSDEPLAVAIRQHVDTHSITQNVWVDNQDVIEKYHISKRTLQTLRQKGLLPYTIFAGRCFYKLEDVERLVTL